MCLDDIIAERKSQPRTRAAGFGGKEGLEDLISDGFRDAVSIVDDRDGECSIAHAE